MMSPIGDLSQMALEKGLTKMGGYGSGRRPHKDLVEHCLNLDISILKRTIIANRVGQAVEGTLDWGGGSSMSYRVLRWPAGKPELMLSYVYMPNTGEVQNKTQRIPIATTACQYGGVRYWLRCSVCSRRMKKLHFTGGEICLVGTATNLSTEAPKKHIKMTGWGDLSV